MCIILQRYYICRARDGDYVDTEEEQAYSENGESHYPGRFLIRCSTPVMVPELNEEVTEDSVLPCHGAYDVKVERYSYPCPDCRGDHPLLEDKPLRVTLHPFISNIEAYGRGIDREGDRLMRRVTERAAESLAKMIYCWISMHWSADLMRPQTVRAPDMVKEIVSTCHDKLCLEHPSHGSLLRIHPSYPKCSCPLNETPFEHNMATAMRHWMIDQTESGYQELKGWAGFVKAQTLFPFDLHDHWRAVTEDDWAENPIFEFVQTDVEPDLSRGEWLGRVENGQGPLFGLEAALECSRMRVERLRDFESRHPVILGYCEPLSAEVVDVRRASLMAKREQVKSLRGQGRGWWISELVMVKIADILANDSGLLDYRIELIMDHFVDAYHRMILIYGDQPGPPGPIDQPPPPGPIDRPPFEPPYVDALFQKVMKNTDEFIRYFEIGWGLDMILVLGRRATFPYWVTPELKDDSDARLSSWRHEYSLTKEIMTIRAWMIDEHVVQYVPGRVTYTCTSCNVTLGREQPPGSQEQPPGSQEQPPGSQEQSPGSQQPRPGSQLRQKCKIRSGYRGTLHDFGDTTFLRKVEGVAGPIDSWSCCICTRDFSSNEPPVEWPTETIRCHGPAHAVAGSACLRLQLLGKGGEDLRLPPRCLMDRQALCVWDQNKLDNQERRNVDDWMNPWAYYARFSRFR